MAVAGTFYILLLDDNISKHHRVWQVGEAKHYAERNRGHCPLPLFLKTFRTAHLLNFGKRGCRQLTIRRLRAGIGMLLRKWARYIPQLTRHLPAINVYFSKKCTKH